MWEIPSEEHQKSITSYLSQGSNDLQLIGENEVRVNIHSTLLMIHSPLIASLLEELGGEGLTAITLPVSLESLTALANLLLGRHVSAEVSEAAKMLGVKWLPSGGEPKLEVNSGEENYLNQEDSTKERKISRLKERDIPCPHCGVPYATQNSLTIHIGRVHKEKEPQKCSHCDYKTPFLSDMKSHWKRKHTDECLETCEFCGEVFKKLKCHLLRTGCGQTNAQPKPKVPCPQCDKTFRDKHDMNVHIKRIHLGVKDKMCSQCSYATYSNHNLKLHISKAHLGTGMAKGRLQINKRD